ncbi:gephyrin-like molybdotransferase Glp [uncultured Psychroserpens sp.]|uniref:molybdopterin molybdotransferase MoeA n=1 Tax=uncultured Psychroserpens sp. TaxID=255436 RepID=UPI0026349726|nr:gephyrin-like molybdotransferase Glp [uncultured Psychroserpens sp.]
MISIKEAYGKIIDNIEPLEGFRMTLSNSSGYFLSKDVISPINMPPFRQSAMDGFAIHIHDLESYQLIGEIKAGDNDRPILKPGEAIRIFTGAAVPDTANAVVMQEKVTVVDNSIVIHGNINKGLNIRPLGEQIKSEETALKKGTLLTPAAIGFLASLGITEVSVYKKPSIAIVTTGNELVAPGTHLQYGQIYESNAIMLVSALQVLGFSNYKTYKVEDNYDNTYNLLQDVISKYDIVLITGGISVGDYDFVGKALKALDVNEIFYKVKQKPGKPLFFGNKNKTTIFALPGNPAAALNCFYIYVYTALQLLSGNSTFQLPKTEKKSTSTFTKKGDRPQFLKAVIKEESVTILDGQSSAMLQTFALANGLVFLPEEIMQVNIGDTVNVITLPN